MSIRLLIVAAVMTASLSSYAPSVLADLIAVIGTGRMGAAIGPRFAETGHTVIYGSRDPAQEKVRALVARTGPGTTATTNDDAVEKADIIVFALPFAATEELIKSNQNEFDGKIIFDITNASLKALTPDHPGAVESSAGQIIQEWAPKSFVVKAFNTVGYHIVSDPSHASGPVTVPLVGNSGAAKMKVAGLVQAMGFETTDSGTIENAHVTEGMAHLYFIPLARREFDEAFEYYFRKGTAPTGVTAKQIRSAD
jgi:predicted dinucleotide-binding enzyme